MSEKLKKFLFFYFIILLIPLYHTPLFETTEARYSEISLEMLKYGNFIEPVFNGIKHFHKPPFTYWITVLGLKLFGVNGFGARFFCVIASLIILIFTYKLAKLILENEEDSFNSVLILSSSLLFIILSKTISTDIYLTLFTILSQYYLFRQLKENKTKNVILYSVFLALGFLTKGPVIFLFTLLPYITNRILKIHKPAFSLKQVIYSVFIFSVISLPWYIAVIYKNPSLLDYFIKVQTVDRITTNRFHRQEPFYFFFIVLIAGFVPYILNFVRNLKNDFVLKNPISKYYTYIIFPFLIFTISKSKLPPYILPFFPLMSVITARNINTLFENKKLRITTNILLLPFLTVFIGAFFIFPSLKDIWYVMLVFFAISLYLYIKVLKNKNISSISIFIIISTLLPYLILPKIENRLNAYRELSDFINRIDPNKKLNVITYRANIPSISFYRQKRTIAVYGRKRETQFEKDKNYKNYYIQNKKDFNLLLENNNDFFTVTKPKYINEIESKGYKCTQIYDYYKFDLYKCKKIER